MQPQDVFYIAATIVMIVFLGIFAFVAIAAVKTMRMVRKVFEEIEDTAQNLTLVKEGFKVGVLTFLSKFLGDKD